MNLMTFSKFVKHSQELVLHPEKRRNSINPVILHKQGKYYIVHFKELFALDGKYANLTINDVQRRNRITKLLADWGLITVNNEDSIIDIAPLNQIKVLPYREKNEWTLEQKYNIGKKGKQEETAAE